MSEVSPSVEAAPGLLAEARAALERNAWQEAYEAFGRADGESPLSGNDLESLATAAFFTAHPDVQVEAKERAFKAYGASGDPIRAAAVALDLGRLYANRSKPSIATGWMRRAERLLDGQQETYAHGYLELARSQVAKQAGDIDGAIQHASRAMEIAARAGDPDFQATAQTALGALRIATGAMSDGFELMEEASFAAVNGELSPFTTGVTYCTMIAACRDATDYQRAAEWTEATERWCERQSVSGFPGICRIHRAEIVALGGAWERAERELHQATSELAAYQAVPPMGDGFYAIAEIRFRMGDLTGAEDALRQAHALGHSPHPALALIRLAQGKVRVAVTDIASAVAEVTWDQLAKTRLLPAQVEIAIAAGDLALARAAVEELGEIVTSYDSPALRAGLHESLGRVLSAEGKPADASRELRTAVGLWREVAAPFEVARARALLSTALRSLDDEDAADLELQAARDEFARLGARLDAEAAERALQAAADRQAAPVHAHKTFVFTDIVGSTNLAELLGDESWERLLRWHDDALRAQFARFAGEVVNSTGDGFFAAFDAARQAVECAIAIQRALADHRRTSGFALSVRIGLHTAEASRRAADYSGIGVHLASRVAALADGGEIVATADTLAEAGQPAATEIRQVSVKGVKAPVSIASIAWA